MNGASIRPLAAEPMSAANPGYRDLDEIVRLAAADGAVRVAVHRIEPGSPAVEPYSAVHSHSDLAEVNVLLGEADGLAYEVTLGSDEPVIATAPCAIMIPPGTSHSANFKRGSGWFVVLRYPASDG